MPDMNVSRLKKYTNGSHGYSFVWLYCVKFSAKVAPSWRNFCCPEEVRILPKWDSIFNQNTLFHQRLIDMNKMHGGRLWELRELKETLEVVTAWEAWWLWKVKGSRDKYMAYGRPSGCFLFVFGLLRREIRRRLWCIYQCKDGYISIISLIRIGDMWNLPL